jgi:hypothetical protein
LAALGKELAELPRRPAPGITTATTDSLQQLNERIRTAKSEWKALRSDRAALAARRQELDRFRKIDEWIPQVEAILWQEKTLVREADALQQLKERIRELERQVEHERIEEKTRQDKKLAASTIDAKAMSRLDLLSDRLRDAERERDLAEQSLAQAEAAPPSDRPLHALTSQVDSVAVHEAQERVERLREQLSWRDDVQQLRHDRTRFEGQVRALYRDQLLPFGTILLFGIPFALGAAMIIHALMSRNGGVHWQQILWGFLIVFVTILIKVLRDREREQLLLTARRRLARLDERLSQYAEDASVEEAAIAAELRAAEQELEDLTGRLPAPQGPPAVDRAVLETARRRVHDIGHRLRELSQQWRELMIDLNLSPSFTPALAREALAERALRHSEAAQAPSDRGLPWQLQSLQDEWERRQEGLRQQLAPFRHFAKELGRSERDESIETLCETLHESARMSRDRSQQRGQWQREYRRLRRKESAVRADIKRLLEQRSRLREESKLRLARVQAQEKQIADRRQQLLAARDRLQQQVDALLQRHVLDPQGRICSLPDAELLAEITAKSGEVASLRESVIRQAELCGQLRGRLHEQELAERPAAGNAESLRPLLDEMQNLHTQIRSLADRPPSVPAISVKRTAHESRYLQIATRHLRRLSGGQYLGLSLRGLNRQLVCRSRHGSWISVKEIRDTQFANIFFALWLTRLQQYADRGLRFPVVLQDPLIVTPAQRKTTVARTLREIAAKGQQMLLVTSSRKNASVLAELGVPIADLSHRGAAAPSLPADLSTDPDLVATKQANGPHNPQLLGGVGS